MLIEGLREKLMSSGYTRRAFFHKNKSENISSQICDNCNNYLKLKVTIVTCSDCNAELILCENCITLEQCPGCESIDRAIEKMIDMDAELMKQSIKDLLL